MLLLNKDTLFVWDEQSQKSFNTIKNALSSSSVLSPPEYIRNFLLYVVMSQEEIGMVLTQLDDDLQDHVIYYVRWNLTDVELRYSHVKKLSLATIHEVQWLRHYILLCYTTIVAHINPFQFILTRWIIGGTYNKWIVIF